jgi:hypothetical protein
MFVPLPSTIAKFLTNPSNEPMSIGRHFARQGSEAFAFRRLREVKTSQANIKAASVQISQDNERRREGGRLGGIMHYGRMPHFLFVSSATVNQRTYLRLANHILFTNTL